METSSASLNIGASLFLPKRLKKKTGYNAVEMHIDSYYWRVVGSTPTVSSELNVFMVEWFNAADIVIKFNYYTLIISMVGWMV